MSIGSTTESKAKDGKKLDKFGREEVTDAQVASTNELVAIAGGFSVGACMLLSFLDYLRANHADDLGMVRDETVAKTNFTQMAFYYLPIIMIFCAYGARSRVKSRHEVGKDEPKSKDGEERGRDTTKREVKASSRKKLD